MAAAGLASLAVGIVIAPLVTTAQDATSAANQQLRTNRQKLEDAERRTRLLQTDMSVIDEERAQLNTRLQETARLIQRSEAQMSFIEGRREELDQQRKLLQGSLAQQHDTIAKLLGAMQRMGRNPPPVIVTRREDALQMVRSAMLLAKAFPHLRGQAEHLVASLTELARVMDEIKVEREKLESETAKLRDAQTRLASLMEVKRQSLAERRHELDEVRRSAQELAKNVTDLSDLISKLDRAVAQSTSLGAYEREASAAATPPPVAKDPTATPVTPPPAATPPAVAQAPAAPASPSGTKVAIAVPPKPAGSVVELAPSGAAFSGNTSRMKPAIAFQLAKAQLPLPAQGKRVLAFGEKTQYGAVSKGIVLETRHSAVVISPCDGWVVYAGEFRTYGQLLIINGGGGYHVLLAGLSQIDVQLGQFVLASEPIGTMRAQPKSKAQDNPPLLFVEFRKDGQSINPDPWWAEASQKVQG